jgi:hypothetical protein
MVIKVLVVLLRLYPNNENDMMDVVHSNDEHADYYLFLDLVQVMAIPSYDDEVDIENKKNHFVLEVKEQEEEEEVEEVVLA